MYYCFLIESLSISSLIVNFFILSRFFLPQLANIPIQTLTQPKINPFLVQEVELQTLVQDLEAELPAMAPLEPLGPAMEPLGPAMAPLGPVMALLAQDMELQAQLLANNLSLSAKIAHKADTGAVHRVTKEKKEGEKEGLGQKLKNLPTKIKEMVTGHHSQQQTGSNYPSWFVLTFLL